MSTCVTFRQTFSDKWELACTALEAYREEYGDCMVPQVYKTPAGVPLGAWVQGQRQRKDTLSPDQRNRLNALDFVWSRHTREQRWEEAYTALESYRNEYGDCLVPQVYKTPAGVPLGAWVQSHRQRKDTLSPDQRERLDALNFAWSRPSRDAGTLAEE